MSRGVQCRWLLAAFIVLATGCGSSPPPVTDPDYRALTRPGTEPAESEVDRAVLQAVDGMAVDAPTPVAGHTVTAGPTYAAASGRACRAVSVSGESAARLVCKIGDTWAFVPDVVATPVAPAGTANDSGAKESAP